MVDRVSADVWASGNAYEPYIGRWSRLVARVFLGWLRPATNLTWLDVGCGTGALTGAILRDAEPARVHAIDRSLSYARYARLQVPDDRVGFAVGDGQALPLADAHVDITVSGLALNFIPNPSAAVAEIARVTRPDGVVAAYVWDYAGKMELMRYFWDAVVALEPGASGLDEGRRFPICSSPALEALFRAAGLKRVESRAIDLSTRFRDFDDYWMPFLGGQGPAPGYVMALDSDRQTALRERLRATLPVDADGSIDLIARAWAVRGTRK